jgi:subfamily B ATP-binding cassette protein MsbA
MVTMIRSINAFITKMDIKVINFIFAAFLSLLAALFGGISTALLIPFTEGILRMDYAFAKRIPVLKSVISYFPKISNIPNASIFLIILGMIVITAIIKNFLEYIACISVAYQVRRATNNIRKLIFARYLSFGKSFYDCSSIGHLSNVLIGFPNTIANYFILMEQILNTFFMFIVYIILMFLISWRFTLLTLLIFPILNYSVNSLIYKIKHTSVLYAESQNKISKYIIDILSCINLVKAYTREEEEKETFDKTSESLAKLEFSIDKRQNLVYPVQDTIMLLIALLLISTVALVVIKGRWGKVSNFLVYFYIMKKSINAFTSLSSVKSYLAILSGPIGEILKVFNDEDKYFIKEGKIDFKGLKEIIEVKGLNFSYPGGRKVLKDINISIAKHRATAIVGPTGAGKTTLINLIMRFYRVPSDAIKIDGVDINDFTLKSLREHIALVAQETLLFNDTIRNNIIYGLDEVNEAMLIDVIKKARLHDFIMSLPQGLDTYIGDRGVRLSGGEKQRISIARVLLKKADILILDEATSSLDTKTEKLIQEAIDEALRDRTAIVIAHRLSTIKNADNIIVIEGGRVVESGLLNELLEKKTKFYEYWTEQKFY